MLDIFSNVRDISQSLGTNGLARSENTFFFLMQHGEFFRNLFACLTGDIRPEFDPEQFYHTSEHNGTNIGGNRDRSPTSEDYHQQNAFFHCSKKVAKKFENSDLAAVLLYFCICNTSDCVSRFNFNQKKTFRNKFWVCMRMADRKNSCKKVSTCMNCALHEL